MTTKTRDSPLYVQVREGESSLWFVIEDGSQNQQQEEDDDIIFRPHDLPQFSYQRCPRNILVINSQLYLLGGVKINYRPVPEGEIQFFHSGPGNDYRTADGVVTTEPLPRMIGEYAHVPQPLAISNNKIYSYGRAGISPNYLFSYDMEEKRWDGIFKHFWGDWTPGVVLSGDSYLIAYGSRHPIIGDTGRPGLWVFDINRRQWLHEPVEGLDEALPVIPDWVHDLVGYVYVYYLPCLFQIGKHRFALIWEESGDESYKLHCHKFTLQAPASADQPFVARQLSSKVKTLNGGNNKIFGFTVGL